MLNNTKQEFHTEVVTGAMEKRAVTSLGSVNQVAANAAEIAQDKSMQRRSRRENRMRRNAPSPRGQWHVSMW